MNFPLRFSLTLIAVAFSGLTHGTAHSVEVVWEVENRFRFYKTQQPFKTYLETAMEARSAGLSDWILHTERHLQQKSFDEATTQEGRWNGWAAKWRDETCWDRQRFLLLNVDRCEDYIVPTSHRVRISATGLPDATKCSVKIVLIGASPPGPLFKSRQKEAEKEQSNVGCQNIPVEVPFSLDGDAGVEATITVQQMPAVTLDPVKIVVRDLLVLGMGDSFAAGVGNPDSPARLDRGVGLFYDEFITHPGGQKRIPVRKGGFDGANLSAISQAQAEWLDIRCFRSQYGPQFRTALHLAVDMRHSAVTFLDLACDGARIIEGLLHRKKLDSGYASSIDNPEAQLGLASRLLCAAPKPVPVVYKLKFASKASECGATEPDQICEFSDRHFQRERLDKTYMRVCGAEGANAFRRKIDVLLLSIGGNDIGFAPMVGDVLMGGKGISNTILNRLAIDASVIHDGATGESRLGLLRGKYDVLDKAIDKHLPLWEGGSKPIFLTAYPLPTDNREGEICGSSAGSAAAARNSLDGNSVFGGFEAPPSSSLAKLKSVIRTSCLLNIRRIGWFKESADSGSALSELTADGQPCAGLQDQAQTGSPRLDWQFEFAMLKKWRGHGFCAVKEGDEAGPTLSMPVFSTQQGTPVFTPELRNMRPYRSRQRWIRTPNDAFVITNWHTFFPRLADFSNHLAASTTSAMHPSAEGFAGIADSLRARVASFICSERSAEFGGEPLCTGP